jgi:secondary thiamine-phosphate synthase enzyme
VKHATDYLWFQTPNRRDYVNITDRVEEFVRERGIAHGLCLVSPMHITAAVYVNDAESGLIQDFDDWLEQLAPARADGAVSAQRRRRQRRRSLEAAPHVPPGRPADHGREARPRPWEQVFYAEFDGRRRKRVVLKAIGE